MGARSPLAPLGYLIVSLKFENTLLLVDHLFDGQLLSLALDANVHKYNGQRGNADSQQYKLDSQGALLEVRSRIRHGPSNE